MHSETLSVFMGTVYSIMALIVFMFVFSLVTPRKGGPKK